jgi:hypothetical protein
MPGGMEAVCPLAVPGTKVSAADTPAGAALAFTTAPEGVADLRSRVRRLAEMHTAHHAGGATGGPGGHAMMPASSATAEETEGGARLVLTPKNPADAEGLRSIVRSRAERMQSGGCAAVHDR